MHTAEGSVQLPTQKWQKTSFVCLKTGQNEERQQKNNEVKGNTAKDSQHMGKKQRNVFTNIGS